ncbi:MAG: general secretion pathway protein GspK [Planctomycetes bacterium]|nr:general secretion pathway protein GspK [Planctomycetota bacterium]
MKESRRGIVLVVVLLVVVLLAAVLLEFNYEARLNLYAADNSSKSQQALCCAEAGLNIAIAVLNQEETDTHEAIKEWLSGGARIPVGDGFCVVSVAEENGKLNTNLLKEEDGVIARRRADQMLRLIDLLNLKREGDSLISYEVVPGIMDWVDADDDVTSLPFVTGANEGAEEDYYQKLPAPYSCKNAPCDVLGELLLVRGMTPEIFEGRPGAHDGDEALDGMRRYLTVYGDGMIDINYAPVLVIQSLSEKIDTSVAQAIVDARKQAPFENVSELAKAPGMTPDILSSISKAICVKPKKAFFSVTATGTARGLSRTVRAVLGSDGSEMSVLLREEM